MAHDNGLEKTQKERRDLKATPYEDQTLKWTPKVFNDI